MNLERLKEIREDKDISQEKMSKILGISRPYYANIENKIRIITIEKLLIFNNYFNISFDYALGLTNIRQYENLKIENKIDFKFIGKNIKRLRISHNQTQEELASIIDVCQSSITHYETGDLKISTNNLCKIAKFYNISIDKLVRRSI